MIEFPTIKYQLKDSDANPFDIDAKENIFFFDGNYSSLSNNTEELDPCYEQSTANSVLVMHRLDFISKGVILKHFQKDEPFISELRATENCFILFCLAN